MQTDVLSHATVVPAVAHLDALAHLPPARVSVVVHCFDDFSVPYHDLLTAALGCSELILDSILILLIQVKIEAFEEVYQWSQSDEASFLLVERLQGGEQVLFELLLRRLLLILQPLVLLH